MNKLQKILGVGIATVALPIMLTGCDKIQKSLAKFPITKIEYCSGVLHEDAKVISKKFEPGEGINIPIFVVYSAISPGMGLALGAAAAEPAAYIVELKGKKASFSLDYLDIYKKLKGKEGQDVDVT